MKYKLSLLILSGVLLSSLTACSSLGVKPWERDLLAKNSMPITIAPLANVIDDPTSFSKEASSGGRAFGGGGCGCN